MAEMTSDQFALMLVEACKLPDIQALIKNIVTSDKELYVDLLSAEVHRAALRVVQWDWGP